MNSDNTLTISTIKNKCSSLLKQFKLNCFCVIKYLVMNI